MNELSYLLGGLKVSDCAEPCRKTVSNTKMLMEGPSLIERSDVNSVTIFFGKDVQIKETKLIRYNSLTVLSFLGANMGLWLGMGVLQFSETFMDFFITKN